MTTERRFIGSGPAGIEVRQDGDRPRTLSGYAALFYRADDPGTEYELWDGAVERILPGAFDAAVSGDDVRALFNHDPNHLLGRTTSGTLRLSVDKVGLRYEVDLPDTQSGRDTATSAGRGDLTGSSFGFSLRSDGARWTRDKGKDVRELRSLALFDVSPVTYPAYKSTTVAVRSDDLGGIREELAAEKAEAEAEAVMARTEEISILEAVARLDD
jgi:HK97 family phage prohead protease